jgi:hypothetical protein
MVQVFVLLTLHALRSTLIALEFDFIDFTTVSRFFGMTVSVLSVNLITVLFINLGAVLNEYFTRINTCLYEVIQCACEYSVGLYRQLCTVKQPQQLIKVNYKSNRPKSRVE